MRCACHNCDTYMVHSEGLELGCVCPNCGYRCKACLGTDYVVGKGSLKDLQFDPALMNDIFSSFDDEDADEERDPFWD